MEKTWLKQYPAGVPANAVTKPREKSSAATPSRDKRREAAARLLAFFDFAFMAVMGSFAK